MSEPIDVVLTFDVDAETLWEARDPESASKPIWLSQGRYGPTVGLPRVLDLLARYAIPASFFVPGLVVQRYPAEIGTIVEAGFGIGHHSHTHTWAKDLGEAQEREEFETALGVLEEFTGSRPRGYRSPSAEFTLRTIALMEEYGFEYSSNMFDGDSPYLLRDGDRETDILEFPFSWYLDDAPFFLYSNKLPGRTISAPSAMLETWTIEFDQLSREPDRCLVVAMHPQVIGRPSRLWVLERFVEHVLEAGNARFRTFEELTDELRPALLQRRSG
ncbi:MAG: polysaccharide deacetylase family protein [Streptosporangiales bacterium]|nr:polysaccharide deacetylase family protein [Streptosporangiales bacterium]